MNLWYELNYTLRAIKKNLSFSVLCVLVIALGYGIAIPLYSIVKNFAYAPLPFPDAERLIVVKQTDSRTGAELSAFSSDLFLFNTFRDNSLSFDVLGAYQESTVTLSGGEYAEPFYGARITADTLTLTATNPVLGRSLSPSDQLPDAEPVVLIGYNAWQNYYAGSSEIIGTFTRIDGIPHSIVGVMPQGFKYPDSIEVWLPLSNELAAEPGDGPSLIIIGKLAENISKSLATAELETLMFTQRTEFPEHYENRSAKVSPLIHASIRNGFTLFNMIGGLAIGIFVLVCVNVGNLLVVRANERVSELAIRSAVGASRFSLISHALFESLIVCLCGTFFGIFLAALGLGFFRSVLLNEFEGGRITPFWMDLGFKAEYLLVAFVLMLLLWVLSGGFAALRASRSNLSMIIDSGFKGASSTRGGRFTRTLVLMQTVLSFALLVIAGAFLVVLPGRYQSSSVELADEYLKAVITLGTEAYNDGSKQGYYRRELQKLLQQETSFDAVTYATALPSALGSSYVRVSRGNEELLAASETGRQYLTWTSDNYFEALRLPLQQGRYFDGSDTEFSEAVAIVDQAFVRDLQFEESPLGQTIQVGSADGSNAELVRIVGIVPNIGSEASESGSSTSKIYRPLSQGVAAGFYLFARIPSGQLQSLIDLESLLKQAGTSIDGDIPISQFNLLRDEMGQENPELKLFGGIFGGAAIAALLLASMGVYGLISRSVFARVNEIGIRRAIGSSNSSIIRMFLRQGLFFIATAIVIGGGGAVLIINALESNLTAFDLYSSLTMVLMTVAAAVGALIFYASYVPVRKIVAMEPGEALHYE